MAVEIATAYVSLVPSATGMQSAIATQMGGPAAAAGGQAGGLFAGGFQKAAGLGAVAGAAVIGKGLFDFVGFERQMNEVFTLIPDGGQVMFDDLTAQTKDFAREFGVLPQDVVTPLYDALSAGVPQDNVFDFLETANQFAKAGGVDLTTAVDGLTTGVNAFGLEAEDATRVSDALFQAVVQGKTTVGELSDSFFQVAPIAATFGVSVEDTTAALATLAAQGTPTSVAATQMKSAIAELGKDGTKASDIFKELTGESFVDFIAGGGTMVDAAGIMSAGADDLGISIVDMFGSIEAGQAFVGLSTDLDTSAANLLAVQNSAGATQVAFEQMEQGIGPVFDKMKAQFAVALIDLGNALAPTVELLGNFALGALEVFTALPAPMRSAIVIFGTLGLAMVALAGPAAKVVKSIGLVGKAFTLLAANPWVLIIIAAVVLAFIIVKYWDEISAAVVATWNWVFAKATEIWNAITQFFVDWWPVLLAVMTGGIGLLVLLIVQNWDAIWAKTQEIWSAITGFIGASVEAVLGFIASVVEKGQAIIDFFAGLPGVVDSAWESVKSATSAAVAFLKAQLDKLFAAADRALGPIDEILGKAGSIIGGALGAIPGFATGGTVPGLRGQPRLILAHSGETVLPTHRMPFLDALSSVGATTTGSVQGGQGGSVYNDFRGVTVRDDADLKAILHAVNGAKRGRGVPVFAGGSEGLNW